MLVAILSFFFGKTIASLTDIAREEGYVEGVQVGCRTIEEMIVLTERTEGDDDFLDESMLGDLPTKANPFSVDEDAELALAVAHSIRSRLADALRLLPKRAGYTKFVVATDNGYVVEQRSDSTNEVRAYITVRTHS
jgi:hypothetical protein